MFTHSFTYRAICCLFAAAAVLPIQGALAQDSEEPEQPDEEIEEIIVAGGHSRIPQDLSAFAGSVTLLEREELVQQALVTNDLAKILANTVPGYGIGNFGSQSNYTQTMRGRTPAIFIDGVPATVPMRNGGRDVRVISPSALERVEVIRGSTAVYGLGGAGGVINYVTRELVDVPTEFGARVALGSSLTHFDDSQNYMVGLDGAGTIGEVTYVFSQMYESWGGLFDAEGDRIAPDPHQQGGIADSDTVSLFGKAGLDLGDAVSAWASVNYYKQEQDTDWSRGVGEFGVVKTPAEPVPTPGEDQFLKNVVVTAGLTFDEVLASRVNVLGFYSDYGAQFSFAAYPNYPPDGGQSVIEAERQGLKLDVSTQLDFGTLSGTALWGVDFTRDTTSQPVLDGRMLVPEIEQSAWAPFVQLELHPSDWVTITGGARYENAELEVATFTTIPFFDHPCCLGGNTVQGGTIDYSDVMFNVGAVLTPFEQGSAQGIGFFATWSQGFTVNEFGRALRSTTAPTVEFFDFEAQVVDSYELGIRADYNRWRASIAGFYSESDLGGSYNAITGQLVRAPEEIDGIEATFEVQATDSLTMGATYSRADGETRPAGGDWMPLDTTRIGAPKMTAYIDYQPSNEWYVGINYAHSMRQQRFDGDPAIYGRADIEAFTLVDVTVRKQLETGALSVAVHNALNEMYFPPDSFINALDDLYAAGPGALLRVTYSVDF